MHPLLCRTLYSELASRVEHDVPRASLQDITATLERSKKLLSFTDPLSPYPMHRQSTISKNHVALTSTQINVLAEWRWSGSPINTRCQEKILYNCCSYLIEVLSRDGPRSVRGSTGVSESIDGLSANEIGTYMC